jgi:tetratricopeptide (TPR) repeat protein
MTSPDAPAQPGPAPVGRLASWLDRQQSRHGFLIAFLASTFLLYLSAGQTRFTFDDLPLIVTNPYLRDWRHLSTVLSAGRAVRGFTLMLDYSLWGLDPMGFHATNVILHLFSVILLYFLVFQIWHRQRLAFVAALLFSFHPVHTEAVIGIAHRKEMLAMVFFCLAYLSYLRWGKSAWGMGFSLAAYLLALLSKQVAVALPVVLLAQELILPRKELSRARRFLPILAFVLLPGLFFLLHFQDFRIFGRFQPVDLVSARYPLILATSLRTFPAYLRLAFFPMHLSVDYDVPLAASVFSPAVLAGGLCLIGLMALILLLARPKPILAFGLAWYLLNLVPVMNLIPANAFLAERYLYLPSAGICLFLAGLIKELAEWPEPVWSRRLRSLAEAGLLFFILFYFFGFTVKHYLRMVVPEGSWHGSLPPAWALIVSAALTAAVMSAALTGLSAWRERGGLPAHSVAWRWALVPLLFFLFYPADLVLTRYLAIGQGSLAGIDINGAYAGWFQWLHREATPGNRGILYYFPTGSLFTELFNLSVFWVGAHSVIVIGVMGLVRHWRRRSANAAMAFLLMAALLLLMQVQVICRVQDWGSEVSLWKATVRENPRSVIGWNNLGRAYSLRKKWPEAEEALKRALALAPDRSDIALNLGILYLQGGNLDRAQAYFEKAVELSPLHVQARLNLGNCYAARGEQQEAIKEYLEVLKLDPRSAHAHYNLAWSYHQLKQEEPALYHVQAALEIAPQYPKALELLKEIRAAMQDQSSDQRH